MTIENAFDTIPQGAIEPPTESDESVSESEISNMINEMEIAVKEEYGQRIAKAMKNIDEVEKDALNRHQNYRYASADSVFRAVRQAFAEAGLAISIQERNPKIVTKDSGKGAKQYFETNYAISVDNGISYEDVFMFVPYLGPQSIQAARTFALKYYLRAKFLIPTGETDSDQEPAFQPIENSVIEIQEQDAAKKTSDALDSINQIISANNTGEE